MTTLILSLTIVTNAVTGGITFTAPEGRAICRADENGPTQTTVVSAPRNTPETAFKECAYGSAEDITRYSVRSIIGELKAMGKFAAFSSFLEAANYDWDFVGSNYLASDDKDFQTMISAIVSQGILTQAELDAMLPKCIWEQTPMN